MAYFEENPRDKLKLIEGGFVYRGKSYKFQDVAHLHFNRLHVTQNMNFSKVGEYDRCDLTIALSDGEKLNLGVNEGGFVMGLRYSRADRIRFLTDFYINCGRETFDSRIRYYMEQVKYKGYFVYEKCRFFLGKKIIIGNNHFPVDDATFSLCNSYVLIRLNRTSLGHAVRNILIGQPQFDTRLDSDVIFYILERHFGVSWN